MDDNSIDLANYQAIAQRSRASDDLDYPDERVFALLGFAALWILASLGPALGALAFLHFVAHLQHVAVHHDPRRIWTVARSAESVTVTLGAHAMLLCASWRRAKVVGRGDRIDGLGLRPMKLRWPLVLACVV